uniref:Transcription termination factor Rho n=1 Tax=uncultured bacterium W5-102b TaxID=1130996 RepID=H9BWL0_9BACT|nr:transcription termination factor Rho [uncultured bacterium W5-102b]
MTSVSVALDDKRVAEQEEKAKFGNQPLADLWEAAEKAKIHNFRKMPKDDIITDLWGEHLQKTGALDRTGFLDILPDGYGFLRCYGYAPSQEDAYVPQGVVKQWRLRRGDELTGTIRMAKSNEKFPALVDLHTVNGVAPEDLGVRPRYETLTPLFPDERLRLEQPSMKGKKAGMTGRVIDIVAPIGKGQRGLIVSPPKAGKTMVLKSIAQSITENNPDVHLICLLVDERPEEVTDMQRSVQGEVVFSTFDQPAENHIQIVELTLDRVKRLVEMGRDVVILLDSITRLARAYNLGAPASGRILSGGVDSAALYPPKRFFGAARNIEFGGSLTIIATALVDTGSKMDEVIYEEFKGTGNMELHLDRKLANKRIYPAINIDMSSTRREELILDPPEAVLVWKLRSVLHSLDPPAALELLLSKLGDVSTNDVFLQAIGKSVASK